MNYELKPCPFCGDSVEVEDSGSCLEITCCCSMVIQKCDFLTTEQKNIETYKYSDESEQNAIGVIVSMWNNRAS